MISQPISLSVPYSVHQMATDTRLLGAVHGAEDGPPPAETRFTGNVYGKNNHGYNISPPVCCWLSHFWNLCCKNESLFVGVFPPYAVQKGPEGTWKDETGSCLDCWMKQKTIWKSQTHFCYLFWNVWMRSEQFNWKLGTVCRHSQRSEKDHFVLDDAPVLTYSYLLGRKFLSIICSVFVSVNSDNSLAQVTVLLWWMFDYLLYANNWRNTNVFWRNNQNG